MKRKSKNEFVGLVYEHVGIIYKICNIYGNPHAREDLKQEIIFQLWKSYPSFREESKFSTWMYRVALNTALFETNKEKRMNNALQTLKQTTNKTAETTEQLELIEQLYIHISKLNEIDKAITFLYLEKCSYREIADVLGMTEKNVGIRLFRIKKKLKELFDKQNSKP